MARRRSLSDRQQRHDASWKKAKRENYAGRAIYKLQDIDEKFRLFRRARVVLDLGCWPGSWLQHARERTPQDSVLVGVDLREVEIELGDNVHTFVGDVEKFRCEKFIERFGHFDLVMSDMAPNTTGNTEADVWHSEQLFRRALAIAVQVLRPGGHFVGKIFQGPQFPGILRDLRTGFHESRAYRSKFTRPGSREQYLIGRGARPRKATDLEHRTA